MDQCVVCVPRQPGYQFPLQAGAPVGVMTRRQYVGGLNKDTVNPIT